MATIIAMDAEEATVAHESTNGNEITFKLTAPVEFGTGQFCVKDSHTVENNTNFPSEIPEIHYHVIDNGSGSNPMTVEEFITITMDDIWEPAAIKLVVKEGGETKGESVYEEDPENIQRPIFQQTNPA